MPAAVTTKGARQADAILEAAYRTLATRGYAASSLQRIANEARVDKRLVLYYFGSRAALLTAVVQRLTDRLLGQVEDAITGLERPDDIVPAGFARLWRAITADPQFHAVYFGLAAESVTDPSLRQALRPLSDGYRQLITRLVDEAVGRGYELQLEPSSVAIAVIAGIQGLTLQYLELGHTPELAQATEAFQRWLVSLARGPVGSQRSAHLSEAPSSRSSAVDLVSC